MAQLLEAVALARASEDLRLLVVGKLRSGCETEFNQTVGRLRLSDIVEVTGWIPYQEVGHMDARAQIGLVTMQPSGNNLGSLSNKVYSYMACGQAVIVPAGSASEELVRNYDCGLAVDTTQPAAIAAAIVRLSRDSELRKRLGRNGRRAIETDLGWHRMECQLRQIYETLFLERPPALQAVAVNPKPL
jgi:glycosyltransferase involved in cell wall biosynthesis